MLNMFGKFCRKLRIDNGELLKTMADKLNVTPAYLSAVELGKRNIPDSWRGILVEKYKLDQKNQRILDKAIHDSIRELKINFQKSNVDQRNAAIMFARKLDELDKQSLTKIMEIVKSGRNGGKA